jgi:large subunit ribosomal protein L24
VRGKGLIMATTSISPTKHKHFDIKRNDTVKVISGRDAGKEGRVLKVLPKTNRILVEHVMMVKKHVRPNPQRNIKGGIAEQETPIAVSNIMLVCKQCGPTRVGHDVRNNKKVRVCKKCNTTLE